MTTKDKSVWILIVFLLAGLVIGGLIGKLASSVPSLWWLCYEQQFGFQVYQVYGGYVMSNNLDFQNHLF